MAKRDRAKFERAEKDFYATPIEPVRPLLHHLPPRCRFIEPCGGAGDLIRHLEAHGHDCVVSVDPEPRSPRVTVGTAETVDTGAAEISITNPPFRKGMIVPILRAAMGWSIASWWLLPSDMLINQYFAPFAPHIVQVVPIGRIVWFDRGADEKTHPSTENFCWVKLDPHQRVAFFAPRAGAVKQVSLASYIIPTYYHHLRVDQRSYRVVLGHFEMSDCVANNCTRSASRLSYRYERQPQKTSRRQPACQVHCGHGDG